jgi:hypothetical protein
MIVWLASYPRSGNTLLRTILKQTLGRGSYSDETLRPNVRFSDAAREEIGHLPMDEPWESFYARARQSAEVHLVKTHLPPRDAGRAIYIVRDGRQALVSYRKYHREFYPEHSAGLLSLLLGDDYYGGWSEHHADWNSGRADTLLVRYEDLLDASPALLARIAGFIGHRGAVGEWKNPFARLHADNPGFFRVGEARWNGSGEWTPLVDAIFFHLHGPLMAALGYATADEAARARAPLTPEMLELVEVARALRGQKRMFERVCRERLAVIEVLDAEVKRLQAARLAS